MASSGFKNYDYVKNSEKNNFSSDVFVESNGTETEKSELLKSQTVERTTLKDKIEENTKKNANVKFRSTRSASCSAATGKHIQRKQKLQSHSSRMLTLESEEWSESREELAKQINISDMKKYLYKTQNTIEEQKQIPPIDSKEALNQAALSIRKILQTIEEGSLNTENAKESLKYAVSVMETRYLDEELSLEENCIDEDAIVPFQGENVMPPEIKRWLVQTFSTRTAEISEKRPGERRTLRGVVHAVQAGMFVERMFRKSSAASSSTIPAEIAKHLENIDSWDFDVFKLEDISGGHALKYTVFNLLNKHGVMRKFEINTKSLMSFCERLETGYRKHGNKYHNPIHAADVTQAVHCFLIHSGSSEWLSYVEIFAMLFAAAIHDVEHTGTTNTFHTQTRSNLALLYNDRSVLENHHISAAFRLIWEDSECNILSQLSTDDYVEFRALVVEMVLATDMSRHVAQIKQLKSALQHPENLERSKAMSLMLHSADINHPTRKWNLHQRWTTRLVEEFFKQGDRERELGLPLSPLCDRHSTMIAQSQIGFINYVIKPTFTLLMDTFWKISEAAFNNSSNSTGNENKRRQSVGSNDVLSRRFSSDWASNASSSNQIVIIKKIKDFQTTIEENVLSNSKSWQEEDEIEQKAKKNLETPPASLNEEDEDNNNIKVENGT